MLSPALWQEDSATRPSLPVVPLQAGPGLCLLRVGTALLRSTCVLALLLMDRTRTLGTAGAMVLSGRGGRAAEAKEAYRRRVVDRMRLWSLSTIEGRTLVAKGSAAPAAC